MASNHKSRGFTIVELMIAMSVFTAAMVLVLAGVIFISRQYQQASAKVALEEASRNIHQQISQSFQFSGVAPKDIAPADGLIDERVSGAYSAICVGNYIYLYGNLEPVASEANYINQAEGLYIKDNKNDCDPAELNTTGAANLLPPGAKVTKFSITTNGVISTVFAKSPSDILIYPASPLGEVSCGATITGREYCATVKLESTATRRIMN